VNVAGRRVWSFVALVVACVGIGVAYLSYVLLREDPPVGATGVPTLPRSAVGTLARRPHIVFRNLALGTDYGHVALVPLGTAGAARASTSLSCERVDFAAGVGICLRADRGVLTRYDAVLFGPDFRPRRSFRLAGAPSRARVSPDGRYAAYTVFVSGHSYAGGSFSTRTAIVSTATGDEVGELEQFTVLKGGKRFRRVDFNFWGVTFSPRAGHFYATLGTSGMTYLVEGDVKSRRLRVLREGVECPSLSPDGRRIAYKVRETTGGRVKWHIAVLALPGGEPVRLGESRSVDDQVEWLDDEHIVYGLADDSDTGTTSVWSIRADGGGRPVRLMSGAWSPSVVRG
jgi:hypothetical protein